MKAAQVSITISLELTLDDIAALQCIQKNEKTAEIAGKIFGRIKKEIEDREIAHQAILDLLEERR